jgi:hypothetical protein
LACSSEHSWGWWSYFYATSTAGHGCWLQVCYQRSAAGPLCRCSNSSSPRLLQPHSSPAQMTKTAQTQLWRAALLLPPPQQLPLSVVDGAIRYYLKPNAAVFTPGLGSDLFPALLAEGNVITLLRFERQSRWLCSSLRPSAAQTGFRSSRHGSLFSPIAASCTNHPANIILPYGPHPTIFPESSLKLMGAYLLTQLEAPPQTFTPCCSIHVFFVT